MNIIYILNATTLAGGGNKSFIRMLEAVRSRHNVMVICPDSRDITPWLRSRGIPVKVFPYIFDIRPDHATVTDIVMFIPRLIKRKLFNYVAAKRLCRIARDFKADILHSNTSVTDIGFMAASRLGLPHVLHVREYGDKDFGMHIYGLGKRLLSPEAYSICITRDISRHRGVDTHPRSTVIYNAITDGAMRYTADKEPYFLYAGRIEEAKGLDDLIDAYTHYVAATPAPMRLKLAGTWETPRRTAYKHSLETAIERGGIAHLVDWLGERTDIHDLMYRASAVIIPSRFEGFGRVMPEALANGCLTVVRDTGGLHEQLENGLSITDGEIALRFTSVAELAAHLTDITRKGPAAFTGMIRRGQDTVSQLYTAESSGDAVNRFYDRIMADRSKSST